MSSKNLMKKSIAAALVGALLSMQASHAAETLPEPVRACKSLRRDSERLACYDKAVAHVESGAASDAALTAENMFGGNTAITPPPGPQNPSEREELQQISGKVVAVDRTVNGLVELRLDNNQVWRQTDTDTTLTIETGDSVTISRASLGTFRLTDKRGRSSRFKRVR
jgi:hypothetical protein